MKNKLLMKKTPVDFHKVSSQKVNKYNKNYTKCTKAQGMVMCMEISMKYSIIYRNNSFHFNKNPSTRIERRTQQRKMTLFKSPWALHFSYNKLVLRTFNPPLESSHIPIYVVLLHMQCILDVDVRLLFFLHLKSSIINNIFMSK